MSSGNPIVLLHNQFFKILGEVLTRIFSSQMIKYLILKCWTLSGGRRLGLFSGSVIHFIKYLALACLPCLPYCSSESYLESLRLILYYLQEIWLPQFQILPIYSSLTSVWGFPRPIEVPWFARRTHRTQHNRFITCKRSQSKINKGKKATGWILAETRCKLPRVHSVDSHRRSLIPSAMSCYNTYEMLSIRESHSRLSAQGSYWGLIMEVTQTNMCQNSRLPEGKQMFIINHTVCTDSLDTVRYYYEFWEWWEGTVLKSEFPDSAKDQLFLEAGFVNSFLHS